MRALVVSAEWKPKESYRLTKEERIKREAYSWEVRCGGTPTLRLKKFPPPTWTMMRFLSESMPVVYVGQAYTSMSFGKRVNQTLILRGKARYDPKADISEADTKAVLNLGEAILETCRKEVETL